MADRDKSSRAQLKLRLPEPIRARLEAEAEQNGYSLNWEVVRRLDQSIKEDDLGNLIFGNRDIFHAAYLFAGIIDALERKTGKKFSSDPSIFDMAVEAMKRYSTLVPAGVVALHLTGRVLAGTREIFDIAADRVIERRSNRDNHEADDAA
jgi:hypothetical protein